MEAKKGIARAVAVSFVGARGSVGSGLVSCPGLPADDAAHGSVVQPQMCGDLRLGIAVLQMQGGDEPVARRALLWFDPAEGLLKAGSDGMALGFGNLLGQGLGLEPGGYLAHEGLLAQQYLPLKLLPGRSNANAFLDKGPVAAAGRQQGLGKVCKQRRGIEKGGKFFQSGGCPVT